MNIKGRNGYMLVKDIPKETERASGLMIPETTNNQDKVAKAEVVAIDELAEKPLAKVGDTVLFKGFAIRQRISVRCLDRFLDLHFCSINRDVAGN